MFGMHRHHALRDWSFDKLELLATLLAIGLVLLVAVWSLLDS